MATWLHAGLQDGGLTQYGLHKGLSNLGLFSGASLDLRFADNKSLADAVTGQSLVTFTRASSATYVGSDGLIKTAATNEPRFNHNPTTGESLGLLVEEQRTNSIRNNTMQGAVAGTPGTSPTNWGIGSLSGLTQTIVGTGTESGIAYIDIRIFGTTSSALFFGIGAEGTTVVAATPNSIWTSTFYVRLAAGSLANVTGLKNVITNFNSAGVALNQFAVASFTPTSAALSTQRSSCSTTSATFANATTAFVRSFFQVEANSGAAIDITLRIGLPQLEQGAFATSVIPTTTAAATRSADVASITGANFSSWYNQAEGTVYGSTGVLPGTPVLWDIGSGGAFGTTAYSSYTGTAWAAQSGSPLNISSSVVASSSSAHAIALRANDTVAAANGGLGVTDTSCSMPAAPTTFTIGKAGWSGAGVYVNGTIRRLTYWPQRLANSTLQAITQ